MTRISKQLRSTTQLLGLLFLLNLSAKATPLFYEAYDWSDKPEYELVDEPGQNVVFLKDMKTIEFFYDPEFNSLVQYSTVHNKIQVNAHEAVEIYNKHYIPTARVLGIEDLRVRVITATGVHEIDEVDLKDYQGEDKYSSYKYFAIDGVEIGSQIEFIYTLKMVPQLEGSREIFQSNELKLNNEFHIYCEDKIHFNIKSYNGFAETKLDTAIEGKNHYSAIVDRIEPLRPEPYGPYQNSLMRVEYKVSFIEPANDVKLYTYDQLANQLNSYFREEISKKSMAKLNKLSQELKLSSLGQEEKIRKIEDYIKRNVSISEAATEDPENIELILEKKVTNQRGVMKLFAWLFETNQVDFLLGLTSDRSRVKMDSEFESYNWLENYLFYFPAIGKYMAPTEMLFRVGFIPYNWSNNYGLFIKSVKIGNTSAGIGEIRFIEPLPYDASEDKIDVKVKIEDDFAAIKLFIDREMSGYNISFIQPIFDLVAEKERKMVINELLNISDKDVVLDEFNMENSSLETFYQKPLILRGVVTTSNSFFDKAGNRYLLKIGELIGDQVEMYQEEARKLPVENEYNRNYERTISFTIPTGYEVRNLDDLNMDLVYKDENGQLSMGFQSNYTVNGKEVKVTIYEFYKSLEYPVEQFENFRKVINAAADFNKKVLIFQKG
jgi:hypothetical protein